MFVLKRIMRSTGCHYVSASKKVENTGRGTTTTMPPENRRSLPLWLAPPPIVDLSQQLRRVPRWNPRPLRNGTFAQAPFRIIIR